MTHTVNLDEATVRLAELVDEASAGAEVVITQAGRPVARIVAAEQGAGQRTPGSAKGVFVVPDDFDAPLDDLRGYM